MTPTIRTPLPSLLGVLVLAGLLVACGEPDRPTINLYRAIHAGDLDQIKRHIHWGTDINQPGPDGERPLHVAASGGRVVIARELIAHGADVDARDAAGRTPLQVALLEGRTQVAKVLVDAGASDAPQALLSLLVRSGVSDRDSLAFVIERGADVNARDQTGSTPLHLAVERDDMDLAKRLIGLGADVNAVDGSGRTPLGIARYRGSRDIGALLLTYGARPAPGERGASP